MPRGAIAFVTVLVFAGAACRSTDSDQSAADNAAAQVQQGLAATQAAAEEATAVQRDTLVERQCRSVTQAAMDAAEERMRHLSEEMVVLTADQQTALTCSRYQKYLRGEIKSY